MIWISLTSSSSHQNNSQFFFSQNHHFFIQQNHTDFPSTMHFPMSLLLFDKNWKCSLIFILIYFLFTEIPHGPNHRQTCRKFDYNKKEKKRKRKKENIHKFINDECWERKRKKKDKKRGKWVSLVWGPLLSPFAW